MSYQITNEDLKLAKRNVLTIKIRLAIYDNRNNFLVNLEGGLVEGTYSENADSDIRRTATITIIPDKKSKTIIDADGLIWLDKRVKLSVGISADFGNTFTWYSKGVYVFTSANTTYDAVTNQMSLDCADLVATLDGTKNGTLGQEVIKIPAYQEDEDTGEVIEYNTLRGSMIYTVSQLGRVNEYNVDDWGEYLGMPDNNDDYETYREESCVPVQDGSLQPIWNTVPYDLEFSSGASVWSIITELRDLYPSIECYFDEEGVFCLNMIPTKYEDDLDVGWQYIEEMIISETDTMSLQDVRNIYEIWGKVID